MLRKFCLLVNCFVENVVYKFLVDIGLVVSILFKNVFMILKNRLVLVEIDLSFIVVDGGRLNILGIVDFYFNFGNYSFCYEFIVVEIDDFNGILRMDFFE